MSRRGLVPALPRTAWWILGGDLLSAIGSGMTLPFLLVYLHRVRGIGLGAAALAASMVAVASFAGNPIGGSLSDRIGARKTLILGLVTSAAGAVSIIFVREAWHGFAAAGLTGLGASIAWPAQDALLAVAVTKAQRSAVFSVRHATLNAGFGLGALSAALVVDFARPGSFVLVYLVDAVTFLAFVPILLRLKGIGDVRPGEVRREPGAYRTVLRDRTFMRVWGLSALLYTIGFGQMSSSFSAFATGPGGISARALSLATAANTVAVVALQLPVLRALDGKRRTRAIAGLSVVWAVTWAVTLGAGRLGGGMAAILAFAFAMVLFALGETMLTPTIPAIVNDLATDDLRGRYNAVSILSYTTGFMFGPAIAGATLEIGNGTALFLGLVVACGWAGAWALRLERHLPAGANIIRAGTEEEIAEESTPPLAAEPMP